MNVLTILAHSAESNPLGGSSLFNLIDLHNNA